MAEEIAASALVIYGLGGHTHTHTRTHTHTHTQTGVPIQETNHAHMTACALR